MGTQRKSVDMHGIRTAKASNAAALLGEGLQRRRTVWQWISFGEQGIGTLWLGTVMNGKGRQGVGTQWFCAVTCGDDLRRQRKEMQ